MTARDQQTILKLHYVDHYPYRKIGRLFGVSHVRISQIINGNKGNTDTLFVDTSICKMCNNDGSTIFYIDGNETNTRQSNVIWLCSFCKERAIKNIQKKESTDLPEDQEVSPL